MTDKLKRILWSEELLNLQNKYPELDFKIKGNNNKLKREDIISHLCGNNECKKICENSLRKLIEKKNLFCKQCCYKIAIDLRKYTNIKKYGYEYPTQSIITKDKFKSTCIEKFGVEYPFQSQEVRNKSKATCLNKYGFEHSLQSQELKDKKIATCLEKFGVEHPGQSIEIKEKIKKTFLEKYSGKHPLQTIEIRDKIKKTNLERYGCTAPPQCEKIKDKSKETCLIKYGFEYSMQSPEILRKAKKNKEYISPSGKKIMIKNHENLILDQLFYEENLSENDILTSTADIPECWYYDEKIDKWHRYYPDIYIPSQNRCIEIISKTSFKKDLNKKKQNALKKLNYKLEIWIYNRKGDIYKHLDL